MPQQRPAGLSLVVLLATMVAGSPATVASASAAEAQLLVRGKWKATTANTLADVKGFTPSDKVHLSPYGGRTDRKTRATGFFHTERIDGRWWMIDPKGRGFYMVGTDHISYHVHW